MRSGQHGAGVIPEKLSPIKQKRQPVTAALHALLFFVPFFCLQYRKDDFSVLPNLKAGNVDRFFDHFRNGPHKNCIFLLDTACPIFPVKNGSPPFQRSLKIPSRNPQHGTDLFYQQMKHNSIFKKIKLILEENLKIFQHSSSDHQNNY